jgi:predicted flap endonuclease-1-like 5' DNA nuclease
MPTTEARGEPLMPYTLMKMLIWLILAVVLGIVTGWMLRNVTARRQVSRARSQRSDVAELERLRGRVANLEAVVAERDRLAAELEACRGGQASSPPSAVSAAGEEPSDMQGFVSVADGATADAAPAESASLPATPDIAAATAVLGRSIELDDLKVIEGIGPKIEDLCHGIGIRTWFDLSTIESSLLRTMLDDAGSRFKMHDPTTWPKQAELLANGRWEDFKALTDDLRGGVQPS